MNNEEYARRGMAEWNRQRDEFYARREQQRQRPFELDEAEARRGAVSPPLAMLEPVDAEPAEAVPVSAEVTPLDFLCAVYRNAGLPLAMRLRAASTAAQYVHPKLAVIATGTSGNIAERLERLILEQKKPKLIEAQLVQQQQLIRRRI